MHDHHQRIKLIPSQYHIHYVKDYTIKYYSSLTKRWMPYPHLLLGNNDVDTKSCHALNITASRIRIYPINCHNLPSMRVMLYSKEWKNKKIKGRIENLNNNLIEKKKKLCKEDLDQIDEDEICNEDDDNDEEWKLYSKLYSKSNSASSSSTNSTSNEYVTFLSNRYNILNDNDKEELINNILNYLIILKNEKKFKKILKILQKYNKILNKNVDKKYNNKSNNNDEMNYNIKYKLKFPSFLQQGKYYLFYNLVSYTLILIFTLTLSLTLILIFTYLLTYLLIYRYL